MAYTTINKSTDYFDTKLHDGNATAKTLAYDFEVDMFWTKMRNDAYPHCLYDVVRGNNQRLRTNGTNADSVTGNTVSFGNSAGISLGTDSGNYGVNKTTTDGGAQATYVGWGWKAGTGQGSSNTAGSINTTYTSVNTTAGFSISKFTGTGANATVGHGLGAVPKVMILKRLENADSWSVYHSSVGATKRLRLNTTDATQTSSSFFNDTEPTSSFFTLGANSEVNGSAEGYIAYCFAEKTGYSKFGSYTGTGSSSNFIYTGFKPAFVMTKCTSNAGEPWLIQDSKRIGYNGITYGLLANSSAAEASETYHEIDFLSNGFNWKGTDTRVNADNYTYIYMAFAEAPLVGSNNIPATAR